jgi:hypothetical protein
VTTQELAAAMALVVKDYMRTDRAALETRLAVAEARLAELTTVPARLVAVETKAAQPVMMPAVELPVPVDLSPVLERLAATEARLSVLGDLRDRVVTIETKAAQPIPLPVIAEPPSPVDLSPVLERLAASEARLNTIGDMRDRVITVETKMAQPMVVPTVDLGDVHDRLARLDAELKAAQPMDVAPVLEKYEALGTEVNALRERIAVAETRQMIPGPMGRDGQPGRDGKDGKDGIDGLGYDDLALLQVDERTAVAKAKRGLHEREIGRFVFHHEVYRDVYEMGKSYDRGDCVTWGGSEWHCNQTTTSKPGDGSKDWTLKVKRGRDGKDGRDAPSLPIVKAGR